MVLLPEPFGPASTRNRGWAGGASLDGDLTTDFWFVRLLGTRKDGTGLHALANGKMLDDGR